MAVKETYCHVSVLVLESFLELKWRGQLVVLLHTKEEVLLSLDNQLENEKFSVALFRPDDGDSSSPHKLLTVLTSCSLGVFFSAEVTEMWKKWMW